MSVNEYHSKVYIMPFDGRLHIDDLLDWEHVVDNFFSFFEVRKRNRSNSWLISCKGGPQLGGIN